MTKELVLSAYTLEVRPAEGIPGLWDVMLIAHGFMSDEICNEWRDLTNGQLAQITREHPLAAIDRSAT